MLYLLFIFCIIYLFYTNNVKNTFILLLIGIFGKVLYSALNIVLKSNSLIFLMSVVLTAIYAVR